MDALSNFNNQFLVATPGLGGTYFEKAVTLIYQHDENGALGITVNQPSKYHLGDILEQMDISWSDTSIGQKAVLNGGPVQPERGFVLHTGKPEWDASIAIDKGWCVTTSRDILVAMAEGDGPQHSLIVLGYAGWGAGQLEDEIKQNAWLTVPAEKSIVFNTPIQDRWTGAAKLLGVDITRFWGQGGNA